MIHLTLQCLKVFKWNLHKRLDPSLDGSLALRPSQTKWATKTFSLEEIEES